MRTEQPLLSARLASSHSVGTLDLGHRSGGLDCSGVSGAYQGLGLAERAVDFLAIAFTSKDLNSALSMFAKRFQERAVGSVLVATSR